MSSFHTKGANIRLPSERIENTMDEIENQGSWHLQGAERGAQGEGRKALSFETEGVRRAPGRENGQRDG